MRWLVLLCFFGLTLASRQAFAQGNDLLGPAGGRAALMGNTGVALGRDGAAALYNPATIVRVQDTHLAFSAHFFSFSLTSFSNWHAPAAPDADQFGSRTLGNTNLTNSTFHLPPSTVCLFLTLEDLAKLSSLNEYQDSPAELEARQKLAFCFASLESEDLDLQAISFNGETRAGPTAQVQSLERHWSRTYVGPTYSVNVNENLALGASLQVVYSQTSFGVSGTTLSNTLDGGGAATTLTTSGRGRTFGLTGLVGATFRHRRYTFGVSARAPVFRISGSYEGAYERSLMGTSQDEEAIVASGSGPMYSSPPVRLAFGAGVALNRLTLEADAALSLPFQSILSTDLEVTQSRLTADGVERNQSSEHYGVKSHPTLNPSLGAEYRLSQGLSLLCGLSANFSSLGALHPTDSIGNLVQARTHHVNASVGMGSYWQDGELLFGLQFDYGWGQAVTLDPYALPNKFAVVDAQTYTLMFVLSGAANLKSILRTVNKIAGSEEAAPDKKK